MALRGPKALQEWCRRVTVGYKDVNISDMSSSFEDGLAFCAIIHHFRPDLIDFDSLKKEDIVHNNQLAFDIAEKKLGIVALLDAPDMAYFKQPDKLSVITYVSSYYNYFKDKMPGDIQEKQLEEVAKHTVENEKNSYSPVSSVLQTPLGDICQVCNKKVYILERQIVNNKLYHRNCYRCCKCLNTLKPGAYLSDVLSGKFECLHCSYEEKHGSNEIESSPLKVNDLINAYESSMVNGFSSPERKNSNPLNSPIINNTKASSRHKENQKPVLQKPSIPVIFKRPKSQVTPEKRPNEITDNDKEINPPTVHDSKEQKTVIKISRDILTSSLNFGEEFSQFNVEEEEKSDKETEKFMSESVELERKLSLDNLEERLSAIKIARITPDFEDETSIESEKDQHNANEQLSNETNKDIGIPEELPHNFNEASKSLESPEKLSKNESGSTSRNLYIKNCRPSRLTPKRFPRHSCPERKYNTIAITSPQYPQHLNPFEDSSNLHSSNSNSTNPFDDSEDEDEENKNIPHQRENPFLNDEDDNNVESFNHIKNHNIEDLLESSFRELDSGAFDSNLNLSKPTVTSTPNEQTNSSESSSQRKRPNKKRHAPLPPLVVENGIKKSVTLPSSAFHSSYGKPFAPAVRIKKIQTESDSDEKRASSSSPSLSRQSLESSGSAQESPRSRKKKHAPLPPVPQKRKVTNLLEFGMHKEAILMELQELDQLQTNLEEKGRTLEKQLRREGDACSNMEEELLIQWFEIVNEKNKLVRREAELIYIQRQQELEEKHTEVEYELRCLMAKLNLHKTEEEQQREEKLLAELLNIVTERNLIVDCIDEERLRQQEEDQRLEEVMTIKSLDVLLKSSKKNKDKSLKKSKKNKKK